VAKRRNRFQQQAADLSLVRYGPEISALTALLRDAASSRDTRLTQATNARQAGVRAVFDARPQVEHAYEAAGQAVSPAFVNGGGIEASALTARLGESAALARSQIEDRRVSAIQGEGSARQQILRDFAQDKGKITARALDLAREQGAYGASTLQQLIGDDAAAKAKARQDAADRQDAMTRALIGQGLLPGPDGSLTPLPGGKADPNAPSNKPKKTWATPVQQAAASDTLQAALNEAKTLKASGAGRHEVAQLLLDGDKGRPERQVPVYDTTTGKKKLHEDGTPVMKTVPAVPPLPQVKSQLLLSAALDIAYDGHLSRRNQRLLHERGVKIGPLGVTTYGQYQRQQQRRRRATGGARLPSLGDFGF
jgi:hypothetical protein